MNKQTRLQRVKTTRRARPVHELGARGHLRSCAYCEELVSALEMAGEVCDRCLEEHATASAAAELMPSNTKRRTR